MTTKLNINRLFIYSEKSNKYYYTEFSDGVNIIHGCNTSGKSSLLQSLLYSFGVNDVKAQLQEILDEDPIFRIDCDIIKDGYVESISLIREGESLYIKKGNNPVNKFYGIGGNNSVEHIKLKKYLCEIFNFSLYLESKDEYKPAPIETMFLPYYISQAVGWVYLRKSFSSLDYYRNFKEDYLDYYLGIYDSKDRLEKQKLIKSLSILENQSKFYVNIERNDLDLQVTRIGDEEFSKDFLEYINAYKDRQDEVLEKEKEYIMKCNELSFYTERKGILRKIKSNHKNQIPVYGECPVCSQNIPHDLSLIYKHSQEENDTEGELIICNTKIKELKSTINSLFTNIERIKEEISKEYNKFKAYSDREISRDNWIKSKANVQLINDISIKLGELQLKEEDVRERLKAYKTEDDIIKERRTKDYLFEHIFNENLEKLGVKKLRDERYTKLYSISSFPYQGVELHKTLLAYHFSLNKLIQKTDYIHRFPFILDAIFKEDITTDNRELMLKFITENKPSDTQLFISIAERKDQNSIENTVCNYNKTYFDNKAILITIGNAEKERALLKPYNNEHSEYRQETIDMMDD